MIHNVTKDLIPLLVDMSSLHIDPANAREHHDIAKIAASLRQYGQRKPIVINRLENNKIEAGNGTFLAANSLGWTHIAAVSVEDDASTAAGYGIADNRVAEFSEWNLDNLKTLTDSLEGLDLFTGWDSESLSGVFKLGSINPGTDPPEPHKGSNYQPQYGVIAICENESQQEKAFEELTSLGYNCRVVVT